MTRQKNYAYHPDNPYYKLPVLKGVNEQILYMSHQRCYRVIKKGEIRQTRLEGIYMFENFFRKKNSDLTAGQFVRTDYREFTKSDLIPCDTGMEGGIRQCIEWTKKIYGKWLKKYHGSIFKTDVNADADYYIYRAFAIYSGIHKGRYDSEKSREYYQIICEEMKKPIAMLPCNIIVYRFCNMEELVKHSNDHEIYPGQILHFDRVVSTGLIRSCLEDLSMNSLDTCLKLYAPKGCKCIFIGFISGVPHEQEMLFGAPLYLKILSIKYGNNGEKNEIEAEIVQENSDKFIL